MKKNKIFLIAAILFVAIIIAFTIHMSSVTTKPWDKKTNNIPGKYKVQ